MPDLEDNLVNTSTAAPLAPLSVEDPPVTPRKGAAGDAGSCFPCEPFKYCPSMVTWLLPATWQKIQDTTHFIIVCGLLACVFMVIQTIVAFMGNGGLSHCKQYLCIREIVSMVFSIPIAIYISNLVRQYDEKLQSKQQAARKEKENLTRSYHELLSDMDGLLQKSAESASGLAERSFESKRRDFLRFLERAKQRYGQHAEWQGFGMPQGDKEIVKQFKRFCANWLKVFEECSIDPIHFPKRVAAPEELVRCTSITEVADLCLERLRTAEVRFISMRRDQDAQMLRKNRTEFRRLTVTRESGSARALVPMPGSSPMPNGSSPMQPGGSYTTATAPQAGGNGRRLSWINLGGTHGFKWNSSESADGFPKEIRFGCGRLVVLSKEHMYLMFGFLLGCILIGFEIYYFANLFVQKRETSSKMLSIWFFVEIIVVQVAVVVLLIKFEELDVIQQLEREVKELAKQNQAVEKQRELMREFWSNAQQLTELWLYRTVPRLDLYKELHSQLEDVQPEDMLTNITGANNALEDLESKLGALEAWRNDGDLKAEDKKQFGKAINQLVQEPDFGEVLGRLEDITSNHMDQFKALPPGTAATERGVFSN